MKFDSRLLETLLQLDHVQVNAVQTKLPPKFSIHVFETLPSTNTTLWQLIDQGAGEGTVAIALQQQQGRGQRGRHWQSPVGGLYLSLSLTPNLTAENGNQLILCSAWGIATALRRYEVPVELKWLNDLVVDGRKLGGILIETRVRQGEITQAVIGVGINWMNPVPETGISLKEILAQQPGSAIASLEILVAIVLQGLMLGYSRWQQQGVASLLVSYQALLTNLDRPVNVGGCLGEIVGVSTTGDLRVRLRSPDSTDRLEICLQPGTVSLGYSGQGTECSM